MEFASEIIWAFSLDNVTIQNDEYRAGLSRWPIETLAVVMEPYPTGKSDYVVF